MKNIYEPKLDFTNDNFPLGEYFLEHFKSVPHVLFSDKRHSIKIGEWLKMNYQLIHEINALIKDKVIPQTKLYRYETLLGNVIIELKYDIPCVFNTEREEVELERENIIVEEMVVSVKCFYQNIEVLKPFLDFLKKDKFKDKYSHRLSIIAKDEFGLRLREFKLDSHKDLDLSLNYGKIFLNTHKEIIKGLEKEESGLILLHGKPGTGKTTYIRHLISVLKCKIIFVPPFMTAILTSPEFIPFLMSHPNSVLVIEDAEKVVGDRKNGTTHEGVANILNLTDGLLSDCLKVKILATFNMEKRHIDDALMRKGRLIAEYKFTALDIKNVKKIFKKLNIKENPKSPMLLSDIYNYNKKDYKLTQKTIGFKT